MLAYFEPALVYSRERNTTTTQIRHGDLLKQQIDTACDILSLDKSEFSRMALEKVAQDVIEYSRTHKLTQDDANAFMMAMDVPVKPTDRAIQAARSFRSRVVHAD